MNRRFEVYQYRQILFHMRQGETDRSIAKSGLIGRKKAGLVRAIGLAEGWLDPMNPIPEDSVLAEKLVIPKKRPKIASLVAPFSEQVRKWAEDGVQATTILDALQRDHGFTGHYSSVRRFVQSVRPSEPDLTMILDFDPGDVAQVDFGTGPLIENPETGKLEKTWFFLMTLAFSRHFYAEIVTSQKILTWQECHRRAFEFFGGIPKKIVIDNLKAAILRACLYDPEVQRSYESFAEGYGFIIAPCPPGDPQKKGRVESGVKYIKNAFLPLRSFRSLTDANRQLREWNLEKASLRVHGTTGKKPFEVFQASEKMFLKPLPDIPAEAVEWAKGQLYRNNHVHFDRNWYSAPHSLFGQELWLRAGPRTVQIFHQNALVAMHPRCFGHGEHQTVNDHLSPACRIFKEHPPEWCREQAALVGVCCLEVIERLLDHPRLDSLRAAQRILRFRDQHGKDRLESACEQALACESIRVTTIKSILQQQVKQAVESPVLASAEPAYQGDGRFVRKNPWAEIGKGEPQ